MVVDYPVSFSTDSLAFSDATSIGILASHVEFLHVAVYSPEVVNVDHSIEVLHDVGLCASLQEPRVLETAASVACCVRDDVFINEREVLNVALGGDKIFAA